MEYLAKPKGIKLDEHIKNVLSEGANIISHHHFVFSKYQNITKKSLEKRLNGSIKYHDEGKKHHKWQFACKKDFEIYLETGDCGRNLLKTGIRHEIESLKLHKDSGFSDPIKVAIASHHSKLSEVFKYRWEEDQQTKEIWIYFKRLSSTIRSNDFIKAILNNYEFSGPRAYLQFTDRRASILEDGLKVPKYIPFEYKFPKEWQKKNVQKIAEDNWQDDLLLLRAPTGAGKTDACLLWAKKQIENNKADRLVIAMPTRFTSNALAINVSESLSDTGLYHSSAWFVNHYEKAKESKISEHFEKLQHEFARILETPVTVCTIDHLLIALTHTREDHHSITFNLSHSCLVIDEADFYDEFTQANILELLKVLKILNVPVLLMSASLPESSLKMYQTTGYTPCEIKEDISDNERIRCNIINKRSYKQIIELDDLLEKAIIKPSIIYANTVTKAIDLYKWFNKKGIKPVLYHSRFTEPDKVLKENELINNLGRKAWETNKSKGIAILTQIGEMSVNISADFMISEICPMDRLVQRIGRLSRFNKTIGELHIIIPQKNDSLYPAPYGKYIKGKGWLPIKPLSKTLTLLECKGYNANEFIKLINQIYPEINEFSPETLDNIDNYRKQIINNWLIVPMAQSEFDDSNTHIWKSRNIEENIMVYVFEPSDYYKSYFEFHYYENNYGVNFPLYLIKKGIEKNKLVKRIINIGDDEKTVFFTNPSVYTKEKGLVIEDNDFEDVFL